MPQAHGHALWQLDTTRTQRIGLDQHTDVQRHAELPFDLILRQAPAQPGRLCQRIGHRPLQQLERCRQAMLASGASQAGCGCKKLLVINQQAHHLIKTRRQRFGKYHRVIIGLHRHGLPVPGMQPETGKARSTHAQLQARHLGRAYALHNFQRIDMRKTLQNLTRITPRT